MQYEDVLVDLGARGDGEIPKAASSQVLLQ